MIGLLFLVIVVLYVILSKYVVSKVYEKTKSVKKKNIAMAIMILIPTWDVILGFPIYAYLCAYESGRKIYKTVNNVEGFYIGEFEEDDDSYNPIEPYKDYRYIEYQITNNKNPTGKFFRNYWLDNNTSKLCINPNLRYPNSSYSHQFRSGKCIAQEEINKAKLSRWELDWVNEESKVTVLGIFFIKDSVIKNSETNSILAEDYRVQWSGGWVNSLISGIHNASLKFTSRSVSCNFRNHGTDIVNQTLKTKKGN